MFPKKQKTKLSPNKLTAQAFMNVEDISDSLLYTKDGYLFGYLSVRAQNSKLLSDREKLREAENLSASLAGERDPWQILSVPKTINTVGMITRLTELKQTVKEDARLKLINGEINALQAMARDGAKEPMLVLKCWAKASKGADTVLKKRLYDLRSRLSDNRISCELMGDTEITYLCKLYADMTTYHSDRDQEHDIPTLTDTEREFTRSDGSGELTDLLTPIGGLNFGLNKVTVGSVVGRVYGAVKYPSELDYGWAMELMNATDCITAITYTPGNVTILGDALSRSIRQAGGEALSEKDVRRRKRFERQAQDADKLIDELDARSAAIGHLSLLVMPFTDREEDLEDVCRAVSAKYSRRRIKLKPLSALQKEGYQQLSPYYPPQGYVEDIVAHIMPLKTLFGGSPMTVNVFRDDNGYYFGKTADGGIVTVDFLHRGGDRTNGNMIATGMSGVGKSTAIKSIAETLYMTGVKVIIIDPEREFKSLCKNLGGTWLDAGGGVAKINPLEIRAVPKDENEESNLYQADDNAMALHIHTLDTLFKLYLPSLTDLQRALVKQALVLLYNRSGITWDTDISTIKPEQYPTCADLYQLLLELAQTDPRYEEISALFYDMAEGADSFLWNGATNVDTDNSFIVFDTNRLQNSSDEIKRAQYFNILTLCWNIIAEDRKQPVFLFCDEAHIMLDPAVPQPAMYLRNFAKRIRKYEGMLGVALQSIVDALHDDIRLYGQALIDCSTYKFLFGTDGRNLQETAEVFRLTEAEQNILLAGKRGKALCLMGQQHIQVDFDIPAYKLELIGNGGGR